MDDYIRDDYGDIVTWTDKEGREWPLYEMSDGHIKNCISMLERNMPTQIPHLQGEEAQLAAEGALLSAQEEISELINWLKMELDRRCHRKKSSTL